MERARKLDTETEPNNTGSGVTRLVVLGSMLESGGNFGADSIAASQQLVAEGQEQVDVSVETFYGRQSHMGE